MKILIPRLLGSLRRAIDRSDEGGAMVEYALLVALVCFAATAGMQELAAKINSACNQVATSTMNAVMGATSGGGGAGGGGGQGGGHGHGGHGGHGGKGGKGGKG